MQLQVPLCVYTHMYVTCMYSVHLLVDNETLLCVTKQQSATILFSTNYSSAEWMAHTCLLLSSLQPGQHSPLRAHAVLSADSSYFVHVTHVTCTYIDIVCHK